MSNKRGLEVKDGKIYIDGVEYKAADDGGDTPSGPAHNTFGKICVYGTSIEASVYSPGPSKTWPQVMTETLEAMDETLELAYMVNPLNEGNVYNLGRSGAGITYWGTDTPMTDAISRGFLLNAISCTEAEKRADISELMRAGKLTQEQVNAVGGNVTNYCYENLVLADGTGYHNDNADLYLIGTWGINDRKDWMTFTKDGVSHTVYDIAADVVFDRRTIYGAYNYVLRQLYARNQDAKVAILGQHAFNWEGQERINEIQRTVAYIWGIPFADWGSKLRVDMPEFGVSANKGGTYLYDDAHVNGNGAEVLGEWVADWITETPLTSLNPNTNVLDLSQCPINPAMS